MSNKDTTYNGWTNYETWAVKLWMDNDQGSYEYWQEATREAWEGTSDKYPNRFIDHKENALIVLTTQLESEHDDASEHPVFEAAAGTVYADLLNAALSEVDWNEIARSLLDDAKFEDEDAGSESEATEIA